MINNKDIIKFIRKRDYIFEKDIGQGGTAKTVLLYDDIINNHFVCKKYEPYYEDLKDVFFKNFVEEIKLLHLIYHINIVRIFNYFLYPEQKTGYILMEYVNGEHIDNYLEKHPENIDSIFIQTIEGFKYLEDNGILHRDIRPQNIIVTEKGIVKIIDFGFGKRVDNISDYDKSITLNWFYDVPNDFEKNKYDHKTEIYFIGKLFEKILNETDSETFSFDDILGKMVLKDYNERIESFEIILKDILTDEISQIEFEEHEIDFYRNFADSLMKIISSIAENAKYITDVSEISNKLERLYKDTILEEVLHNNRSLINCFINGNYRYNEEIINMYIIHNFINMFRKIPKHKKNIIVRNLINRLESINKYPEWEDDLPF